MVAMYLNTIHCDEGTNELTPDEPYVLVTVVDLAAVIRVAGFPLPMPARMRSSSHGTPARPLGGRPFLGLG